MAEHDEIVNHVEVLETGELLLCLKGGGKPSYQHVYREAAGVSWDDARGGFKSTVPQSMPYPEWCAHILWICNQGICTIHMDSDITWINISERDKEGILDATTHP